MYSAKFVLRKPDMWCCANSKWEGIFGRLGCIAGGMVGGEKAVWQGVFFFFISFHMYLDGWAGVRERG